jgi:hypothetical protein
MEVTRTDLGRFKPGVSFRRRRLKSEKRQAAAADCSRGYILSIGGWLRAAARWHNLQLSR